MKFLHIADLHIGKTLNDVSFLPDQEHILSQIVQIAEEENTDAVLIAGDVYQRSNPSAEAMAIFDKFLTKLVQIGQKVFIISGNHDSSERISYFSSLIRTSGVYVSESFTGTLQKVRLTDEGGAIDICLLPFLRPSSARRFFPDKEISDYKDAVQAALMSTPIDPSVRNIALCHQFITGGEISDSEEISIGTLEQIPSSLFDSFDYTALGHLHKPQKISKDTLRYAGSPLKYSFSEIGHKKSAAIVSMPKKGETEISLRPLHPLRDMRMVKGSFSDLMNEKPSQDYIWAVVTDEIVAPDAKLDLTAVFPNMLKFTVENSRTKADCDVDISSQGLENKSVNELFIDFYRLLNGGQTPTDMHMQVLSDVLSRLEGKTHEAD
ncbi:MAG: exonuclease SbcCD subunit D [Clostridia bacterium]|nr:exonuclease SbcCD subunit D [Clostridia bacterium]